MFVTILAVTAAVMSGVSLILHAVAPLTKTKADDKARDAVDYVKDKVLPVVGAVAPVADNKAPKMEAKPVEGFGLARDHRK